MPVHNAGEFLVPAIESIRTQTYPRIELIIVDDGSTDRSWEKIRAYKRRYPKLIRAYRTDKQLNSAGNGATDIGLSHAKGQFVARMDADDISHPKRIEKQVTYMTLHPMTILVGTQADIIDKNGKITGTKSVPCDHETIYEQYGIVHPIIHPSVMVRRNGLPNLDKLYLHKWGINDDYYSFFKLLTHGEFANLPERLLKYRIHGGNSSLSNIREKCFNTLHIRLEAMKYFNYRMSLTSLAVMGIQVAIVTLVPNPLLEKIYPVLRGMDTTPQKYVKKWLRKVRNMVFAHPLVRKYTVAGKL